MLWNKCLLASSLLSAVLAVPLRSRGASAEDEEFTANPIIGHYDKRDPNPIAKDDEEYFPNMAIGHYDNDKRDPNPIAKDDEEFFSNTVIGKYDNDKRDANADVANNMVIGHYDPPVTETI